MLITFIAAIIVGLGYADEVNSYNTVTKLNLSENCSSANLDECIYRQLIYRASFSLVLLFTLLALISYYSDYVNRSLWILKFMTALGIFVGFWWVDNTFFSGWAEAARVISMFWLLIQGLLYLDIAHDSHDILMAAADEAERETGDSRWYYVAYLTISILFLVASLVGIVFLYLNFGGCSTGLWFTSVTLVSGVILLVVSLLNTVNKGLLTPCLMFAYSTFMCWYALLSSPNGSCNAYAADNWGSNKVAAVSLVGAVSLCVLVYCIAYGTALLNIFNPEGQGVLLHHHTSYAASRELKSVFQGEDKVSAALRDGNPSLSQPLSPSAPSSSSIAPDTDDSTASGTTSERVYFHLLLVMFSCYTAMILTSWGNTDGTPEGGAVGSAVSGTNAMTRAEESMWIKIASQWLFLLLYSKVLHAAFLDNLN